MLSCPLVGQESGQHEERKDSRPTDRVRVSEDVCSQARAAERRPELNLIGHALAVYLVSTHGWQSVELIKTGQWPRILALWTQ